MATLKITSTLDPSGFNRGIDGMKRKAKEVSIGGGAGGGGIFGSIMGGGIGGLVKAAAMLSPVIAAFTTLKKAITDSYTELVGLSNEARNLGTTAPDLNTLKDTFEHFGASGEKAVSIFERLDMARDAAIEGNKDAIESFKKLGMTLNELAGMTSQQVIEKALAAYAAGGPTGEAGSALEKIVGKRGMMGARYAMRQYGSGARKDYAFEPNQDTADTMLAAENIKRSIWEGIKNWASGMTARTLSVLPGISDEKTTLKEQRERNAELDRAQRRSDLRQAKEREEQLIARKRLEIEQDYKDRIEEATRGIRGTSMQTDQFQRIGIGLGPNVNMSQYREGMRQIEIAEKTKELNAEMLKKLEKMEKSMKIVADAASEDTGDF